MKNVLILMVVGLFLFPASSCVVHFGHRPPQGVIVVKTKPAHYKIVKVKGKKYYHWNNNHYQRVRGGYILVRF